MTPERFAERMREVFQYARGDAERERAVELMCEVLKQLGYGEGVKVYELTLDEE